MRTINIISLITILASALITWNAIAAVSPRADLAPQAHAPFHGTKIHILQNLDQASLNKVIQVLKKRGYEPTTKPIFSESNSTVVFTRTDANEIEPASIQFEIIMKKDRALPKTIFAYRATSSKVEDVLNALPDPKKLKDLQIGQN